MNRERDLLWFFDLALVLKVVNGALEIFGALLVLVVPPAFILKVVQFATAGELANDPDDFIATHLRSAAQTFAIHTHYIVALYLALHGIIKVFLVFGIFAGKRMAYPLFMLALAVFGAYEAYRGIVLHDTLLGVLALFDCMLLLLTFYEYRRRYRQG